jgi:RNA polymerase sigma-70 factor (ECF subfamily)
LARRFSLLLAEFSCPIKIEAEGKDTIIFCEIVADLSAWESKMSHSALWNLFGRKAMDGDVEALGVLLESYRPQLKTIAGRSLSPRLLVKADLSDVVQETFENACGNFRRSSVTNGKQFWLWLRSMLVRRVCDVHRIYIYSKKRSLARETSVNDCRSAMVLDESTASERLMRIESAEMLSQSILKLPRPYRMVLELRYLEDLSCEEIAAEINRSPDAVRMLVNRAIARLRTQMTAVSR